MARYRSIQTSFWQDNFVIRLPLIEKAFYNYLMTNTRTSQCGIYSFSITFSSVELGCSEEEIKELLDRFVSYGKILYDEVNEEIMLLNWYKYNLTISKNTLICVNRELWDVKNKEFVRRFYELCKNKKYPLDIIFCGVDIGDTIEADEVKEEIQEEIHKGQEDGQTSLTYVAKQFNENIHLMSPIELEDIRDWCKRLNEDIVILAMSEAARNNGRNLKYIEGILINWHNEGLKTAEEVKLYLKNWKNTGGRHQKETDNMQNADAYRIIEDEGA